MASKSERRVPSDDAMARATALAEEIIIAKEIVAQQEESLRSAKERLRTLDEVELPELMAELGLIEFKMNDGSKVTIKEDVYGGIGPLDEKAKAAAMDYVEANNGGPLIKTNVSLAFGKNQHNEALSLAGELREKGYEVSVENGIHSQTLKKFVRELQDDDKIVDLELLGMISLRKAIITPPRMR